MANPLKDPYAEAAPRGGKPVDPAQIKTAAPMAMPEAPSMAVPGMVVPPVGSANIQANAAGADAAGRTMANAAALGNRPLVESAKDGPLSQPRPESGSPTVMDSLKGAFPGTTAVIKGTLDDANDTFQKGQYLRNLAGVAKGALALPVGLSFDIARSAQNTLAPAAHEIGVGLGVTQDRPAAAKPTGAPAVIPTSPDGGIPLGSQNPLRNLESRIPTIRNGDRQSVPLPPGYEPGAEKVNGVYGQDIGGGVKKFEKPGQSPLYTNMEGAGAGFENRREITPQNAAAMNALAGRYENQQRQAAQAQIAREQAGPGPQVSIMNSGMRGNMRINDNGDKGQSIADMVKTLKSNGIKVSHNTLRTMLANQGQREAAQIQANASMYGHDSSSRTQMATNANTVNAQREGHHLQADTAMAGHQMTAQSNRIRQAFEQKKFGVEQGWKGLEHERAVKNDARAGREHGEKMFNESVGKMFPGQEGAADAAAFTKAAHHTIANHVNNLRKSGSPEAMAKAQEIEANPWSSEMMSRLAQGYQVRKTSRENHGNWGTPGSGKHVESDDLFSYTVDPTRKTDKGMFDNEVPLRNGGTISENAASGTSAIKNAFGYGRRTQDQINYINQR